LYYDAHRSKDRRGVVRNPTKVEAFRVKPTPDPTDSTNLDGYPVIGSPIPVDEKLAKQLSDALLDPSSYAGKPKFGGFQPVIAFRFTGEDSRVVVLLDFETNTATTAFSGSQDGRLASFDPGRARLVRLVKRVHSADESVKKLKENLEDK
jgi:hypothetical protein